MAGVRLAPVLWAAAALALLVGVSFAASTLPLRDWAAALAGWVALHGILARVLFVLVYAAAVVALVPATVPTLAGGLLFGIFAFPLSLAAATLGAVGAFLVSRHLVRTRVARLVAGRPKSRAVYDAVGRGGWTFVILWRLSPVLPFSLLNYLLGATELPLATFASASAVGIIPAIALYTYVGALGKVALAGQGVGPLRWALLLAGLAATIGAIAYLGRRAAAELRAARP